MFVAVVYLRRITSIAIMASMASTGITPLFKNLTPVLLMSLP